MMYRGKTINELGLSDYNVINIKGDNLILLYKDLYRPDDDCDGFKFSALSTYSIPEGSDITYEVLFDGVAYFDGVRHLFFGNEDTDNYGYLYCQDLPDLITALQNLDELQIKKCEYVRKERNND